MIQLMKSTQVFEFPAGNGVLVNGITYSKVRGIWDEDTDIFHVNSIIGLCFAIGKAAGRELHLDEELYFSAGGDILALYHYWDNEDDGAKLRKLGFRVIEELEIV
jgi:hypothetical protein